MSLWHPNAATAHRGERNKSLARCGNPRLKLRVRMFPPLHEITVRLDRSRRVTALFVHPPDGFEDRRRNREIAPVART